MQHPPVKMRATVYDSFYKRGGDTLFKRYTCPRCGKVLMFRSRVPKVTDYFCDGIDPKKQETRG